MWYLPIEWHEVEHLKKTLTELDAVIQRQEHEKRVFNLAKKASYVHMVLGDLMMAAAPIGVGIQYTHTSIGFKEIAAAAVVGLAGLALCYFGKQVRKWAGDEEKVAQERQNELLDERVEFLEMKKENEKSPAYQALVN